MATRTVHIQLPDELLEGLVDRVSAGEATSLDRLIEADLRYAQLTSRSEQEEADEILAAIEEMESGADPGIPIEEVMARYGSTVPGSTRKAA